MLVLSRRERESIVIGNGIVVTVLAVKGKTVRLGIDAPPEVVVHRQEVQKRIQSEIARPPVLEGEVLSLPVCQ
jgi:carbon storage regulator